MKIFTANNQVSVIEFHITAQELEDFTIRASELIKDGYCYDKIRQDPLTLTYLNAPEPNIHITLKRKELKY